MVFWVSALVLLIQLLWVLFVLENMAGRFFLYVAINAVKMMVEKISLPRRRNVLW